MTTIKLDPLGNLLRRCQTYAMCPYPCQMTLPHYHSIIPTPQRDLETRHYRQGFIDAVTMAHRDGLGRVMVAAQAMAKHQ